MWVRGVGFGVQVERSAFRRESKGKSMQIKHVVAEMELFVDKFDMVSFVDKRNRVPLGFV